MKSFLRKPQKKNTNMNTKKIPEEKEEEKEEKKIWLKNCFLRKQINQIY